jgi:ABC-type transporter Mla subunit MlaD
MLSRGTINRAFKKSPQLCFVVNFLLVCKLATGGDFWSIPDCFLAATCAYSARNRLKQKNKTDILIALSVVLSSIVLLGALFFAVLGFPVGTGRLLNVDMPSITGLRVHSQVRYAGNPVGRITGIRTLGWEERGREGYPIRLDIQVNADLPELKEDSYASISADTILAEKFLDIAPGTERSMPLAAGAPIPAAPGTQMGDLLATGARLLGDIGALAAELRSDYPDFRSSLGGIFSSLNEVTDEAGLLMGKAESLFLEAGGVLETGDAAAGELRELLAKADALAGDADKLVSRTDAVVGRTDELLSRIDGLVAGQDGKWAETAGDLRVTLQNLKVTSTYLKIFSDRVSREPWRLVWGTRRTQEIPTPEEILRSRAPLPVPDGD